MQPGKRARTVYFGLCHHLVSSACTCNPNQKYAYRNHDQNLRLVELFTSTLSRCQTQLFHVYYHTCVPLIETQGSPLASAVHTMPFLTVCHTSAEHLLPLSWDDVLRDGVLCSIPRIRHCLLAVLIQHSIVLFAHSLT